MTLTSLRRARRRSTRSVGRRTGPLAALFPIVALAAALGGCGGDDGPDLPPLAAEGRDLVRSSGCAACHGSNGQGGVGPSWVGLFGGTEDLESGETVTVDEEYLHRSIADPGADRVAGYTVVMPANNLSDPEIDAVIAYIRELR